LTVFSELNTATFRKLIESVFDKLFAFFSLFFVVKINMGVNVGSFSDLETKKAEKARFGCFTNISFVTFLEISKICLFHEKNNFGKTLNLGDIFFLR
jgi:hypothetical protein